MPVIYFDNFRGFNNTFLPLKDVNFFVGENSTGKTSVLQLIKIVSDAKFLFTQDFNTDDVELGYFSEIAGNKGDYFEIGILGDKKDKNCISALKLKYINKNGLPYLQEVCMIEKNLNLQLLSESNTKLTFRHETVDLGKVDESNKLQHFKLWIKNNGLKNIEYKDTLHSSENFMNGLFFHIQIIIATQIIKNNKEDKLSGIRMPAFLRDISWLAPIRTEPKRTYDSYKILFNSSGSHSPYLLKRLLEKTNKGQKKVKNILEKFGQDSGLFEGISIKTLGDSETSPFELQVQLFENSLKITNVGYGVSQILPLIVEVLASENDSWFAIQQPEIHLHPKAQAAFGDFIFKSGIAENKSFIIETHSDFTIDRFRLKVHNHNKTKSRKRLSSQVVFFNRTSSGNELSTVSINDDGSYSDNQPKGFRDFFLKEELELLKM